MAVPAGHEDAAQVGLRGTTIVSVRAANRLAAVAALVAVLVAAGGLGGANVVRATPAPLKAVIIVGPTHDLTQQNLTDGELIAQAAESYGMDVRRVFFPNATWANVLANVDGANLVVYLGHGYGWPSPYPPFRERLQNGIGLDPYVGAPKSSVEYHGAKQVRENWHLAPDAVVFLSHLCYAAGQSEAGMAVPSWDVARQRVDNMASGYLYAGASAVFAYSMQPFEKTLDLLMTTDQTIDQIFRTSGPQPHSYYGWVGADPRYFDSVRTPGARNLIDPDPSTAYEFERAVTGDLTMTAGQWRNGTGAWSAPTFQDNPPTPQGVTAQALSNLAVQVSWRPVSVNYFGGVTYRVFRDGKAIARVAGATSFTDHPSVAGTYRYQVMAIDPARAKSALSSYVSVVARR